MQLQDLKRSKGLKDKARRKGRGNASKGNTSGRGNKWQWARAGYSRKPFFEWGQTPLVQRIPKMRGFKRYFKLLEDYNVINVSTFDSDERVIDKVNKEVLVALWYIKNEEELVKVLWQWEITKKLQCSGLEKYSKSAQDKIEKAGGKIELVPEKVKEKKVEKKFK